MGRALDWRQYNDRDERTVVGNIVQLGLPRGGGEAGHWTGDVHPSDPSDSLTPCVEPSLLPGLKVFLTIK